jgi:hypothetical protein
VPELELAQFVRADKHNLAPRCELVAGLDLPAARRADA